MIAKIIEWSIKNKFMVMLATSFVVLGGALAMLNTPLDAIPDLSDVQVIIFTEYPGQAPQVVEDQVTYPITNQRYLPEGYSRLRHPKRARIHPEKHRFLRA